MAVDDWINVPAEQNNGWAARWNAWMHRLVRYLRALDATYSWTPVLAQGGVVANTATVAEYTRQGDSIQGYCHLTASAAGVAANQVTVSAPLVASPAPTLSVGSGYCFAGGVTYPVQVYLLSNNTFAFYHTNALSSFLGTGVFAGALAAGNLVSFNFTYPV